MSEGVDELVILCAALGVVCIFDYTRRKIPNPLVLIILLAGAVRGCYLGGLRGLGSFLGESVTVLLFLYPFFRIGGLGAGDVKLLSVCAGYFPMDKILFFLFFSLLFSVFFSIFKLLHEHNATERIKYFCEYCAAVAYSGRWRLYLPEKREQKFSGICMSGPILCSVLLGLGGFY